MKIKLYQIVSLLLSLTLSSITAAKNVNAAVTDKQKPNVIFILVDDMGYSDIGSYGGEIQTPHLDSLAKNGVRFTQMNNAAKCYPSRASLLTGLYGQQNGMYNKSIKFENAITLAEALKSVGYRTLASGKHHSRESLYDRGFDRVEGLLGGAGNHFSFSGRWMKDDKVIRPKKVKDDSFYSTDYYTQNAINYLEQYKSEDKPFFLYVSYTAPHDPLQAWPEDIKKYEDTYNVGYEKIRQARYKKMQQLGLVDKSAPLTASTYQPWEDLSPRQRKIEARKMAVYAAMIDRVDQNVGKLVNKLKALGKFENTLIMFASDNGSSHRSAEKRGNKKIKLVEEGNDIALIGTKEYWASLNLNWANVSNTPFRFYKRSSFSGGATTPFIAHWPNGITAPKGSINKTFAGHFVDVMPTLIDITGAAYPKAFRNEKIIPMAGESFLPQLKGNVSPRHRPIFWQFLTSKAVRYQNWKAISDIGKWNSDTTGDWQLFDMSLDRTERKNLAKKEPEKLKELVTLFERWYESTPAGKNN